MRITKRLSALALAMCMLITIGFSAAAVSFSDVPDSSPYKEAITSLASLDLIKGYEDGTFAPDKTITRAEFAAVIDRALGLEEVAENASALSIFTDMKNASGEEHWGSGYVKVAYDLKIVSGYGDGTFGPDNEVTYEQVVKMIVCTLGYGAAAEAKGGWPQGYLAVGADLGITKGAVVTVTSQNAPRGLVAKLLYNSLEIPLMEPSKDNYVVTDKTLLKDKLKVVKLDNVMVVDVEGNSLNPGASTVREGQLVLEESDGAREVYNFTNVLTSSAANALLGHYVTGFYKEDTVLDERVLISIDTSSTKNTSIKIKSGDIDSYSGSRTLEYWVNKSTDANTKSIDIASDAKLIYNGKARDYKAENKNLSYWLSPDSEEFLYGEVTLLDSGADGDANVIFMYDYDTYVSNEAVKTTDTIDSNNYIIYDHYQSGKNVRLDVEDRNISVTILNAATGAEMPISSIVPYNIVSVAQSFDQKKYTVYVSTKTVSGKITEMANDGSKYTIGGTEYELTPDFDRVVNELNKETMELDTSGTFYLDMYGRIAAAKVSATTAGNYAYVTAAKEGGGLDVNPYVKLFIPGQAAPVYKQMADKVKLDGATISSQSALGKLEETAALLNSNKSSGNITITGATYTQPVKYTLNSAGKVDSIVRLSTEEVWDDIDKDEVKDEDELSLAPDIGDNTNSSMLKLRKQVSTLEYTGTNNFDNQVYINSSTTVLLVPDSRSTDADYRKITPSSFFTTGTTYRVEVWDSSTSVAKLLIVYGAIGDKAINTDTTISVVISKTTKVSELSDGSVVSLSVYENGVQKTYETEDASSTYTDIQPGDVLRMGYNNLGQVNTIEYAQKASSLVPNYYHSTETYDSGYRYQTITGTVYTITDSSIVIAKDMVNAEGKLTNVTDDNKGFQLTSALKIYTVDLTKSPAVVETTASPSAITAYGDLENANASVVFGYAYLNTLRAIVIYKR